MLNRTCSLCGLTKPLTAFREDKNAKDGRRNQCKECMRERKRKWYIRHRDRVSKEHKSYRDKNKEALRARDREYYKKNTDERLTYQRYYYLENTDVVKARVRSYEKRNVKKVKARKRAYYEQNRDAHLARARAYRKENPLKIRNINAKRRADKIRATPKWADHELIELIYEECPDGHHVDHIFPLKGKEVCGLHVESNLQYLPAIVNLRKNNRIMET